MSRYGHINTEERELIFKMLINHKSARETAMILRRSHTTVSRELKRNTNLYEMYSPSKAEMNYRERRKKCRQEKLLADEETKLKVQELFLEQQWSPEQIAKRLEYESNPISISYSTIYRGIYDGMLEVKKLSHKERGVARKLRHHGKKRHNKDIIERRGRRTIANTIDKRPEEADKRKEIGHWEIDTVHGKKYTGSLVTMADRCSRYYIAERVSSIKAESIANHVTEIINHLPPDKIKTITSDRGSEFTQDGMVTDATGVPFYFTDPHSPWQRPTNENFNGLLREYLPKGSDFRQHSDEDIKVYIKKLNTRPRKCLGWKTPLEAFFSIVVHLT